MYEVSWYEMDHKTKARWVAKVKRLTNAEANELAAAMQPDATNIGLAVEKILGIPPGDYFCCLVITKPMIIG